MKSRNFLGLAAAFVIAAACSSSPADVTSDWKPVGDKIMTRWAAEVDPANVLPEYPRPQMVRDNWVNLNGMWDYAITHKDAEPSAFDGKILVPFAVESALSGVGRSVTADDALWYSREFTVPKSWKGNRVLLNFGAVDWKTEVYVDGKLAGSHTGGYDPFSFDITDLLAKGKKHNLTVKVLDQTDKWYQPCGKQILDPHGIWYTPVSGIWQTVWMEPVPQTYIKSFTAVPDVAGAKLAVEVKVENMQPGDVCRVQMFDGETLAAEGHGYKDALWVSHPLKLWSPDNPFLYDLKVVILRKGKVVDEVKGYAAMREITVAKDADGHKRMLLNGEPLFQYGPLDQGWWPDGLYTAPTDEALVYDIEKTKEFGFNMIRKHVKVEPARWYWHCDRLGMLVWQDMPSPKHDENNWSNREYDAGTDSKITQEGKGNFYNEWAEIISDFKIFPCIVVWVPFNEAWGQFDTDKVVQFTREQDPSRLINYASGGNFVRCSGDILDLHNYPDPEMYLYDPDYINVLGEYGGIGLPLEGHLWQTDRNWGYIQYKTGDDVLDAYERYAEELIELIQKGFAAAVYTQTTDVEGEVNGLMTYDREVVKVDVDRLSKINRTVIESL